MSATTLFFRKYLLLMVLCLLCVPATRLYAEDYPEDLPEVESIVGDFDSLLDEAANSSTSCGDSMLVENSCAAAEMLLETLIPFLLEELEHRPRIYNVLLPKADEVITFAENEIRSHNAAFAAGLITAEVKNNSVAAATKLKQLAMEYKAAIATAKEAFPALSAQLEAAKAVLVVAKEEDNPTVKKTLLDSALAKTKEVVERLKELEQSIRAKSAEVNAQKRVVGANAIIVQLGNGGDFGTEGTGFGEEEIPLIE